MTRVVRLDLAYDGTDFAGWAAQPGFRTVQQELETALATLFRRDVPLTVAGRTDSGVHAWGQVASFPLKEGEELPEMLQRSLNGMTGVDLTVHGVSVIDGGFDARRDARSRTYCFRLLAAGVPSPFERRFSLWRSAQLDFEALRACAEMTAGAHDFTAFTPAETVHTHFRRNVSRCAWVKADAQGPIGPVGDRGELWELWITADAFLRNMIRALVGTMLEVATQKMTTDAYAELLTGRPREDAGPTAAAHGLHFVSVAYDRANGVEPGDKGSWKVPVCKGHRSLEQQPLFTYRNGCS